MTHAGRRFGDADHILVARVIDVAKSVKGAWLKGCRRSHFAAGMILGRIMLLKSAQNWPKSELCSTTARSARRQEVDRVNDRDRDDVFLGAEVEGLHATDDLCSQVRRVHRRRMQLTHGH